MGPSIQSAENCGAWEVLVIYVEFLPLLCLPLAFFVGRYWPRHAPDPDLMRADAWRREAEDEVAQLKSLDHRAMRKFIRDGEG